MCVCVCVCACVCMCTYVYERANHAYDFVERTMSNRLSLTFMHRSHAPLSMFDLLRCSVSSTSFRPRPNGGLTMADISRGDGKRGGGV